MNQAQGDEINIEQVAVRLIRYFKKHFAFLGACTLTGLALGITGYFALPKVYQSNMILVSDILTKSYSDGITESLENLIKEKNYSTLAERLGLTEGDASQISTIRIEAVKKLVGAEKEEGTTFIVTTDIRSREILPQLQDGIISYLRNNEYVKIRVRQREFFFQTVIEKIGNELQSLDSLKHRMVEGKPLYAKSSEMLLVDPATIYKQIIDLTREQTSYKNQLELANSVQLVEGFTAFRKPARPKLSLMIFMGITIGMLVGVGTLAFGHLTKLANEPT